MAREVVTWGHHSQPTQRAVEPKKDWQRRDRMASAKVPRGAGAGSGEYSVLHGRQQYTRKFLKMPSV